MTMALVRPSPSECAEYYFTYIDRVPDRDILELYREQVDTSERMLSSIPEDRHGYRYAPGKWTVREVIGHVIDLERIFAFRAFSFARREPAPLPSMEQEPYVAAARYDDRNMETIIREYVTVKRANLAFFESLDSDEWQRRGIASGVEFTVGSIPFIMAGHEIHHWAILEDRYL